MGVTNSKKKRINEDVHSFLKELFKDNKNIDSIDAIFDPTFRSSIPPKVLTGLFLTFDVNNKNSLNLQDLTDSYALMYDASSYETILFLSSFYLKATNSYERKLRKQPMRELMKDIFYYRKSTISSEEYKRIENCLNDLFGDQDSVLNIYLAEWLEDHRNHDLVTWFYKMTKHLLPLRVAQSPLTSPRSQVFLNSDQLYNKISQQLKAPVDSVEDLGLAFRNLIRKQNQSDNSTLRIAALALFFSNYLPPALASLVAQSFDVNRNLLIDVYEFIHSCIRISKCNDQNLSACVDFIFSVLDATHSGSITFDQFNTLNEYSKRKATLLSKEKQKYKSFDLLKFKKFVEEGKDEGVCLQVVLMIKYSLAVQINTFGNSKEEEKELIEFALVDLKSVVKGENMYLIPVEWWKKWCKYVNFENNHDKDGTEKSSTLPPNLDMLFLVEFQHYYSNTLLKENVTMDDVLLVTKSVWLLFSTWYFNEKTCISLPRTVVKVNPLEVDLFPLKVKVISCNTLGDPIKYTSKDILISKQDNIINLYKYCTQTLSDSVDFANVRLWICSCNAQTKCDCNILIHLNLECTVEDIDLKNNLILIEIKNKDGKWPRRHLTSRRFSKDFTLEEQVSTEKKFVKLGLKNLGNSCYLNAILQNLCRIPLLKEYFISKRYLFDMHIFNKSTSRGSVAFAFAKLVQTLGTETPSLNHYVPTEMQKALAKSQPLFDNKLQQDAQEVLISLLNFLGEDLNKVKSKPYTSLPDSNNRPDEEVAAEAWNDHISREKNVFTALFTGQLKSLTKCLTCDFESTKFDIFQGLELPLPINKMVKLSFFFIGYKSAEKALKCSIRVPFGSSLMLIKKSILSLYTSFTAETAVFDEKKLLNQLILAYKMHDYDVPILINKQEELYEENNNDRNSFNFYLVSSYAPIEKLVSIVHRRCVKTNNISNWELFCKSRVITLNDCSTNISLYVLISEYSNRWIKRGKVNLEIEENRDGFEFVLRYVNSSGLACSKCSWFEGCKGCIIKCNQEFLSISNNEVIAVDWSGECLFKSFDEEEAKSFDIHSSVAAVNDAENFPLSLDDCFREYFKTEKIEAYCGGKCKSFQRVSKTFKIFRAPPVLIISLKRFMSESENAVTFKKVSDYVDFKINGLSLVEYYVNSVNGIESNSKGKSSRKQNSNTSFGGIDRRLGYDLFGVVDHRGTLALGHYVANIRGEENQWYHYDDSRVSLVDVSEVVNQNAYILFYERKEVPAQSLSHYFPCQTFNASTDLDRIELLLSCCIYWSNYKRRKFTNDIDEAAKLIQNCYRERKRKKRGGFIFPRSSNSYWSFNANDTNSLLAFFLISIAIYYAYGFLAYFYSFF